jgi:hypothetical protein
MAIYSFVIGVGTHHGSVKIAKKLRAASTYGQTIDSTRLKIADGCGLRAGVAIHHLLLRLWSTRLCVTEDRESEWLQDGTSVHHSSPIPRSNSAKRGSQNENEEGRDPVRPL